MTFGVLADTHIPDRMPRIPARAIEVLRDLAVDGILHAGDLCRLRVLDELTQVAPVTAVRGNRDELWPENWSLPRRRVLERDGATIVLTHGQRGIVDYLQGLVRGQTGETPDVIEARLCRRHRAASAIVYGHTHVPRVTRIGETLLINPGSLAPEYYTALGATLAVLRVDGGRVDAEIVTVS